LENIDESVFEDNGSSYLENNHLHKANKISKEQSKEEIKKTFLGHQSKGMKLFFMGIVIHVMDMVSKLLNVDLMKGDIMEDFITT
jgi:hypothetical protein